MGTAYLSDLFAFLLLRRFCVRDMIGFDQIEPIHFRVNDETAWSHLQFSDLLIEDGTEFFQSENAARESTSDGGMMTNVESTYRRVLPAMATMPSGHCSDAKPDACSRDSYDRGVKWKRP